MYNRRSEPNEFVGDSVEEARAKAAEFFGTEESELKVVSAAAGEIFGAAGRTVIVAVPKGVQRARPQGRDRGGAGGDRREAAEERGRGGRRERGREGREGREGRSGRGGSRSEPVAVEDSKGKAQGEVGPIGEFLLGALERMKLGSFEISESEEGDFVIYALRGAAADALRGGDGRAVDALQLIANQVAMRQDEDAPRVVVDVEGGGEHRERTLGRLAERAIKRAKETGRAVALDPMGARDRRAIHLVARDEDGVATMSIGEGRYRQVLVVPEGAPEYDDAVAESNRG